MVLQQRRHLLGVNGLGAEPEELLGVHEVPEGSGLAIMKTTLERRCYILGEVAALVLELAVLDGLGLLLLFLLGGRCGSLLNSGGLGGNLRGGLGSY